MIQDRLTAKFQNVKSVKGRETKSQLVTKTKVTKAPATDAYTRGRPIAGSFWL